MPDLLVAISVGWYSKKLKESCPSVQQESSTMCLSVMRALTARVHSMCKGTAEGVLKV